MEVCHCSPSSEECKKIGEKILTLDPDILTENTVHALQHSGFKKIKVLFDARTTPHIFNTVGGIVYIYRIIQLNAKFIVEETLIASDKTAEWTVFKDLSWQAIPELILEAEEVNE